LFQFQEVVPQKAWGLDDGSWPAWFNVSDLTCQAKLKEQSELVLIAPCQEGEEKSFIQKDDLLKNVALNEKGEITRTVLSPMRAKGLEFARVVLYKFGEQAVLDGYTEKIERLAQMRGQTVKREETLGLEYFFNGLYVGASRAFKVTPTSGKKELSPKSFSLEGVTHDCGRTEPNPAALCRAHAYPRHAARGAGALLESCAVGCLV
jgi:hypothetical protein